MATTSLPSFAVAFSDSSIGSMGSPGNNALPPIQHRRAKSPPSETNGRKRGRAEITTAEEQTEARIKQEEHDPDGEASASSAKKRRVALPLNTTNVGRATSSEAAAQQSPISPAVAMGFNYAVIRDKPNAMDQVRSSISAKHKQKALIDQRRGSIADDAAGPVPRPHPPTPPPPHAGNHPPQHAHTLPAPPISFARRRAEQLGGKRKPADIIISPREAHTKESFAPAIQSAPPIPQAAGRYPMSIPRLPPVMGMASTTGGERRVAGIVPPTPTRLAMQRNNSANAIPSISHPGTNARSPPAASVPISSSLVPPTPTSLQHATYSGDKAAFLAPFEVFYDALNDSKQLKTWLGDQLQKSNALIHNLTQQQEKLNETVEHMVERRLAPMRAEMNGLYRRVDELEEALRAASDSGGAAGSKGKKPVRNGNAFGADFTFPPRARRAPSPAGAGHDSETGGSPAPFDSRRLSTSAMRSSFETSSQRNTLNTPPQNTVQQQRETPLSRSPSQTAAKPPPRQLSSQPGSRRTSPAPTAEA
uniref:Extracellular mutant protein 11 C-terminal domain-containing protein n=1 Tax=Mycena chlorophos TaxID=658473 RepID=A0ABQ0M7D0_MYCCL|nr:predicted protein [Mycena chlorophos]